MSFLPLVVAHTSCTYTRLHAWLMLAYCMTANFANTLHGIAPGMAHAVRVCCYHVKRPSPCTLPTTPLLFPPDEILVPALNPGLLQPPVGCVHRTLPPLLVCEEGEGGTLRLRRKSTSGRQKSGAYKKRRAVSQMAVSDDHGTQVARLHGTRAQRALD